ncbi:hypothetical protein Tco_1136362 [Tanacetum coccineum]
MSVREEAGVDSGSAENDSLRPGTSLQGFQFHHGWVTRRLSRRSHSAPKTLILWSSQTWVGEASTFTVPLSVEDYRKRRRLRTECPWGSCGFGLLTRLSAGGSILVRGVAYNCFAGCVGMPISAGITASVLYVSENGVSSLLDLIIVRRAHKTCESSPIQSLLLSFMPEPLSAVCVRRRSNGGMA